MPNVSRPLVGLAALITGACGSSGSTNAPPALTLNVTVDSGAVPGVTNGVKADGTNSVTIDVGGSTKGPIRVSAHKGSFLGGGTTAMIEGTGGSVTLFTCDARTDNSCAGTTTVTATDGNFAFGETTLTFVAFETNCQNRIDDNKDGRTDCADPDCDQRPCVDATGNNGVCASGVCTPPVCTPISTTEVCDNGVDDDCDGKIDCMQATCDGMACKPGSPTFVCQSRACTDVGTGYAITATAKRPRIPADGLATTTITAKLTKTAVPQIGVVLDFSTDLGAFVTGTTTAATTSASTGADGTATVTFQGSAAAGVATITVAPHSLQQLTQTTTVTMPALGSIVLGTIQNPVMGVKFSGVDEQNSISVKLLDTEQKPYPDGLAVRFEHQQLQNSLISMPFAPDTATCKQAAGCLGYIGETSSPTKADTQGLAFVNLYSGTAAGLVSISVSATAGEQTRTFTVQNIAIIGAKASGAHISLLCTPLNVPGFVNTDCLKAGTGGPITCTVFLADRFNNVLGRETLATFSSEAGSAGPPVKTKAYDPTKGGDQTAELGHVSNTVSVTGFDLPQDVAPLTDEYHLVYNAGCGSADHNPRDGLSTIIVAVQGEEGFVDNNGNGTYDPGEPFVDSGEPFIDENDNNVRDDLEPFIDVNMNGKYDGPNGKWDASTTIWAETRVLYTSEAQTGDNWSRWLESGDVSIPPDTTTTPMFQVMAMPATSEGFAVFFTDINFNPLAPTVTYDISSLVGNVSAMFTSGPSKADSLGMVFQQHYCNAPTPSTACFSTCRFAPCYRVTTISNYAFGSFGAASISGVKAGDDQVAASATVAGKKTIITISGTAK
jgi:hypothetical protein